ncbi:MAG: HIT domain-containing protein [Candidatus Gracilibacteria bacterium]|nr:HIT domain-containing protein [Candidatus Gracilibacteria bacterium]MDD4529944.1 HIT domain-containing protein [Candidatus Gracilibacteria bacterium]
MCVFCKIINKELSGEFVFEDQNLIVIKDLYPQAKTHYLIIPKKHISTISDIEDHDRDLIGGLFLVARDLAKKEKILGYKLNFNVGKEGGQEIMHVHLHFLAN